MDSTDARLKDKGFRTWAIDLLTTTKQGRFVRVHYHGGIDGVTLAPEGSRALASVEELWREYRTQE